MGDTMKVVEVEGMWKVVEGKPKVAEGKPKVEEGMRMKDTCDMVMETDMLWPLVDKKLDKLLEVQNIEGHAEEELYIVVLLEHMLWLAAAIIQVTV